MSQPASSAMPLLITLNASSGASRHRQIFDAIRGAILSGRLARGAQVPPTRVLAAELGVARSTVVVAYEYLEAEGYLSAARGSGTYVALDLPDSLKAVGPPAVRAEAKPYRAPSLSVSGGDWAATAEEDTPGRSLRPFRLGEPALDAFPVEIWQQLQRRRWRADPRAFLGYGDPAGFRPLRKAIAEYLRAARGVKATPDQIVLTRGTQQGLDLAARMLLNPGDSVWLEDPGYRVAHAILSGARCRTVSVPVDGEGLVVAEGVQRASGARAAFVVPSHQYPLGVTMSRTRRRELLEWACQCGAWIVEDDFDSEFRYGGQPELAVQGLDTEGRVIYLGTFSKTLFPAIRLGYMVVPPDAVTAFLAGRTLMDCLSPSLEQAVLADFLIEGHFARHLRRMRTLYAARQESLLEAATTHLEGLVQIEPAETGTHVVGWLRDGVDDRAASEAAFKAGVDVAPLSRYCVETKRAPALLFGYAAADAGCIKDAVCKLQRALLPLMSGRRPVQLALPRMPR